MLVKLETLTAGSRFKLPDAPEIPVVGKTGVLLYTTPCRARVKFDTTGPKTIEVTAHKGTKDETKFTVPNIDYPTDIAPTTEVEVLS
jgi:hypothetical protein